MAETLLSFGVERLWNILVRESARYQGFDEQFNGLKRDVEMLRCFLEDADTKKHTSSVVRKTIKDIKEIALDAEDIVETFLLKEQLGNTSGIRKIVRRFSCVSLERRGLASDIKAIRKKISDVIREMQSFGVQHAIINEGYTQSLREKQWDVRQTSPWEIEDHLVGLDKNVEILVGKLMEEDSGQVVSITGMGGIGKTTLARHVFNHETIKNHFLGFAWVCVSQQFTKKRVWQMILRQLRPECEVSKMMEDELLEKIVQVLETQKALIVIDDIWEEGDWDRIKHVFLPKKGWKVLLTSRNEEVGLHADRQCVTFKPECLTFEESWDLLRRIAFPMKDTVEYTVDDEMEEIGQQMIKHCGELPLALKVLGGLLGKKNKLHDWKRIYENIKAHILGETSFNDKNISSVYHVLNLSFEELPIYLKLCFLCLGLFPEDYPICLEDLSCFWAAEGIPRPRYYDGASIRDVADGYIEELVKRNLVISKRDVNTSRFETCQLHDMMRVVCLCKAEEENFLQNFQATSTADSKSPYKSRRLVVHGSDETFNVDKKVKNQSLRTLVILRSEGWVPTSLFFTRHKLMRVLDLSWVFFEGGKVPSSIGELIHLRYLSLYRAVVTHLPSSMRNLKQLLYLNLFVGPIFDMPNFLKEMRELAYLYLPLLIKNKVKMELGKLVNLETLKNFSTEHGSVSDLQGMTQLRTLSIYIEGKGCSMETLSSYISKLSHLEDLTIKEFKLDSTIHDDEGFVLDCAHLRQLELCVYMPMLPEHFSSHLTTIHLEQCRLKEDPMPILEKLLHLEEINLMSQSFCGSGMVCSKGGFLQLKKLALHRLEELEEWIVEERSMPLLHSLKVRSCKKLKELPHGLRFITSLKDLNVSYIGEECKMRLSEAYLPFHLTTIHLSHCCFEENPIPILEKLLHLKRIILTDISFCGRRVICSRGGFPQLKNLTLGKVEELEEWIVEEGSMPLLHSLLIGYCKKLEKWIVEKGSMPRLHALYIWGCRELNELPDGLRFITSLKDLKCYEEGQKWRTRLSEGGEDYYKVRHIPSIRFE